MPPPRPPARALHLKIRLPLTAEVVPNPEQRRNDRSTGLPNGGPSAIPGIPLDHLSSPLLIKVVHRQLFQQHAQRHDDEGEQVRRNGAGSPHATDQWRHASGRDTNGGAEPPRSSSPQLSGAASSARVNSHVNRQRYLQRVQRDLPLARGVDELGNEFEVSLPASPSANTSLFLQSSSAVYGSPQAYKKPFTSNAKGMKNSRTNSFRCSLLDKDMGQQSTPLNDDESEGSNLSSANSSCYTLNRSHTPSKLLLAAHQNVCRKSMDHPTPSNRGRDSMLFSAATPKTSFQFRRNNSSPETHTTMVPSTVPTGSEDLPPFPNEQRATRTPQQSYSPKNPNGTCPLKKEGLRHHAHRSGESLSATSSRSHKDTGFSSDDDQPSVSSSTEDGEEPYSSPPAHQYYHNRPPPYKGKGETERDGPLHVGKRSPPVRTTRLSTPQNKRRMNTDAGSPVRFQGTKYTTGRDRRISSSWNASQSFDDQHYPLLNPYTPFAPSDFGVTSSSHSPTNARETSLSNTRLLGQTNNVFFGNREDAEGRQDTPPQVPVHQGRVGLWSPSQKPPPPRSQQPQPHGHRTRPTR